jgi:hypothetical protein
MKKQNTTQHGAGAGDDGANLGLESKGSIGRIRRNLLRGSEENQLLHSISFTMAGEKKAMWPRGSFLTATGRGKT